MPAGLGVLVDKSDMAIGVFIDQRVSKSQADSACADDQVIRLQLRHAHRSFWGASCISFSLADTTLRLLRTHHHTVVCDLD